MAIKQKLYYNIVFGSVNAIDVNIAGVGFGGGALAASPVAIRFTDSSGTFGNNADLDRYGNLLDPNQFAGASGNGAKTRQAIGAWLQIGNGIPGGAVMVDFIPEKGLSTALAVGTAPSIDPATQRRPRVRVGYAGLLSASGTLYIQRQHAIEV